MSLNEEIDCNASLDAPYAPEPEQCGHTLRCRLIAGHDTEPGAQTIARDHWAPHGGALQVNRDGQVGKIGAYWKSEASDDPANVSEALELARLILADPHHNDHVAQVGPQGWVIQHPIGERVESTMLICPAAAARELDYLLSRCDPGKYVVRLEDDGRMWSVQPVKTDD